MNAEMMIEQKSPLIAGLLLSLCMSSFPVQAQPTITGVRMWPAPDNTRLVFDVSASVSHTLFTLSDPERIVIDVSGITLSHSISKNYNTDLLKGIRSGVRNDDELRIVLDLKQKARPKSFMLRPNAQYGHRLVVDLYPVAGSKKSARKISEERQRVRDVVIAIDPGHGGEDPGAIGPRKTKEKDVVLAISRKLAHLIGKERGMKAALIRDGDYYVGLKQRLSKAREERADLFISVHADAFPDPRARGTSIYTLSSTGASSEQARWLAERENEADLVGGVSLDDKDDLLASVLLDLSQTATLEASLDVASHMLKRLGQVNRLHKRQAEQAGFRVLKAPDIPSILVETAFISNPREERKLTSSKHQHAVARAMLDGIRSYFAANPLPGTRLARQSTVEHVISRGDTLSDIAVQYGVRLDTLKSINALKGTTLRVGEVLRIPTGS